MDTTADSVPIVAPEAAAGAQSSARPLRARFGNLKVLLALFLIFVTVSSDFFTSHVVAGFGEKAVRCRSPTSWGVVIQGIFLVILFVLVQAALENGVL